MDYYFLDENNQAKGPLSRESLLDLHMAGAIVTDQTLVAASGTDDWTSFAEMFSEGVKLHTEAVAPASMAPPSQPEPRQSGIKEKAPKRSRGLVVFVVGLGCIVLLAWAVMVILRPKTHPLAEWYDFGHRQGTDALRIYGDFGINTEPDHAQIAHLLKNVGVDVETLDPAAVSLCYDGYKDGFEARKPAYALGPEQHVSILPPLLSGEVVQSPKQEPVLEFKNGVYRFTTPGPAPVKEGPDRPDISGMSTAQLKELFMNTRDPDETGFYLEEINHRAFVLRDPEARNLAALTAELARLNKEGADRGNPVEAMAWAHWQKCIERLHFYENLR